MATNARSFAELNLDVFRGKPTRRVLWQPRLEQWYEYNKAGGTLPAHMKDFSLIDVYDYCHASIRYFVAPLKRRFRTVRLRERWLDDVQLELVYETPLSNLREVIHHDEYRLSPYRSEHRIKTPEDFKLEEYLLGDEDWYWDQAEYERALAMINGRGAPQFYFRRAPIQTLFIQTLGFENTIFMMADFPQVIEHYAEAQMAADEQMYRVLCEAPISILNFGENIDANMDPPEIWRKHLVPYYRKRVQQLQAVSKFTHIHVDGSLKPLIQDLSESPFDAIEACTPEPQGDVTLQEIKEAVGDRIFLDGIPAVLFLPLYSTERIIDFAKQVIELFYPKLILGISDEMPPDGDIERVRLIGEMLETLRV